MTPREFLELLFLDLEPGHRITAWHPPGVSEHFEDFALAARWIEAQAETTDLYIHPGLRQPGLNRQQRGSKREVTGIVAFVVDIDFARPGKEGFFPDRDKALDFILKRLPWKPTAIVETGNGFHVWFVFHEPWIFKGPDDRRRADGLNLGIIRHIAEISPYEIDIGAWGIERQWRVPGTFNYKSDTPKPVGLAFLDADVRSDPEDFAETYTEPAESFETGLQSTDLELDVNCQIPYSFAQAALANRRLSDTYWHHRKLPEHERAGQTSLSSYDMALTRLCLRDLKLTYQEVVDVILCHRRQWAGRPGHYAHAKINKGPQYFLTTLGKVDLVRGVVTPDELTVTNLADRGDYAPVMQFGQAVGLPLTQLVRYGPKTEGRLRYAMILHDGRRLEVGLMKIVRKATTWQNWTLVLYPERYPKKWPSRKAFDELLTAALAVAVTDDEIDNSERAEMAYQIMQYFRTEDVVRLTDEDAAETIAYRLESSLPFERDGRWYVVKNALFDWLRLRSGYKGDVTELGRWMKDLGFQRDPQEKRYGPRAEGKKARRSYWSVDAEALLAIELETYEKESDDGPIEAADDPATGRGIPGVQ